MRSVRVSEARGRYVRGVISAGVFSPEQTRYLEEELERIGAAVANHDDGLGTLADLNTANGFDLQSVPSQGDISFVEATRTVSIDVAAGESAYTYHIGGIKYLQRDAKSVVIPDVTGIYYVYFDSSNTMVATEQSALVAEVFYTYAIVALVYWNATSGEGLFGDERHGYRMSSSTHEYNHKTTGARYESGFDPVGLTSGVTGYTSVNSGIIWDEDIAHDIAMYTDIPWIYRLGAAGEWTLVTADTSVALDVGGSYAVWNEDTGTTWQLTEGGVLTDYFITFFVATGFETPAELYKIPGQNAYSTVKLAREAIYNEIASLQINGLPSHEMVFLYAMVVKRDGTLQTLDDGGLYWDLRYTSGAGGGGAGSAATLAGDIATSVTNFDKVLSSADTNVQLALDTIDEVALSKTSTTAQTVVSAVTIDSRDIAADGAVLDALDALHPCWKEINLPFTQTDLSDVWNSQTFDTTNVGKLFPQNDATEIVYLITKLPSGYDPGTDIIPRVHWQQSSSSFPVWKIDYKWIVSGGAVPASFTTVSANTGAFSYSSGDLLQVSAFSALSGTGKDVASLLLVKCYRDDNVVSGDVLGFSLDIRYQSDAPGEAV